MHRRNHVFWLVLLMLIACSGASCVRRSTGPTAPVAFVGTPSLEQVMQVVNNNSSRIHQLEATGAELSVSGYPDLRAELSFERPRRLRLRAASIRGTELDLGSNDEVFWMWVASSQPSAVHFGRHGQYDFESSNTIPVSPEWLIDALGVLQLNPNGAHDGPHRRANGQLEIRTQMGSARHSLIRTITVDGTTGWVTQQHLINTRGQVVATATASQHEHYPEHQVSLPRQVTISLPTAGITFTLEVNRFTVNVLPPDTSQRWAMPQPEGVPLVDISRSPAAPADVGRTRAQPYSFPRDARRPWLRGINGLGDGQIR